MALTLTRKASEAIQIGEDIIVTVNRIHGSRKVVLSVEAPSEYLILRIEPEGKSDEQNS